MNCLGHGVLLVFGAPCQLPSLAGQEHGRTIPLADIGSGGGVSRNPGGTNAKENEFIWFLNQSQMTFSQTDQAQP
jgi:hypothetical protein